MKMRDSQTFFAVILGSVDIIASEAVTTQILKHEKKQEVVDN